MLGTESNTAKSTSAADELLDGNSCIVIKKPCSDEIKEKIKISDIKVFKINKSYIDISHSKGVSVIKRPLKEIAEQLCGEGKPFIRIHRSVLVRKNCIIGAEVRKDNEGKNKYYAVLKNPNNEELKKLQISRRKIGSVRNFLYSKAGYKVVQIKGKIKYKVDNILVNTKRKYILHKTLKTVELLTIKNISSFRSKDKYVTVMYKGKEKIIEESLKSLESYFCGEGKPFIKIHRNALVKKSKIKKLIEINKKAYIVLDDGKELEVSRREVQSVKNFIRFKFYKTKGDKTNTNKVSDKYILSESSKSIELLKIKKISHIYIKEKDTLVMYNGKERAINNSITSLKKLLCGEGKPFIEINENTLVKKSEINLIKQDKTSCYSLHIRLKDGYEIRIEKIFLKTIQAIINHNKGLETNK